MKKRTKLQAAILAALASSSYANESCLTDVEDKGLLEVFQCIEAKLNTQQNRIAELEKENLRLQQKTDAISVSSDGKVGICTTPSQLIDVLGDARIGKTNARHYLEIASQSWPEIRWTTPTYTKVPVVVQAALKVNLVYEFKQNTIHELFVTSGAISDQTCSGTILRRLEANDLVLRDLGYFKINSFSNIEAKNAFYLSRLFNCVDIYLNVDSETPINLPKYLKKAYARENVIDLTVYIGKFDRLKTRLIAYKPPQEIIRMRRYKANPSFR